MYDPLKRLEKIVSLIDDIEYIFSSNELKISQAIENKILKPAIRMHIVRIAEQFGKLKEENQFQILQHFSSQDLRGISAVRNFIAHDYDATDDRIIEDVIRFNLPQIKQTIQSILKEHK